MFVKLFVLFLFVTWVYGTCSTAFESLLTVFISTITKNSTFVGAALIIQCTSELLPFYFSHHMLKWPGPNGMVCIAIVTFVVISCDVKFPRWTSFALYGQNEQRNEDKKTK